MVTFRCVIRLDRVSNKDSQTQTNVPLNRHTYSCPRLERSGLDNPQLHKTRTDPATGY